MALNQINGGTHYHQYPFQQEIPFEKRDKRQAIVFTETELDKISKIAESRGFSSLSPFLRKMVFIGIKFEKYLNASLIDILK